MRISLCAEHDALRKVVGDLRVLLDGPRPEDLAPVIRLRMEFARLFRGHIAAERDYAQHCVMGAGKPVRKVVEEHFQRFSQLYFDYSSHVHQWRNGRIQEDWHGYGRAVRALQTRFLDLLDWEESEVLPVLARADEDAFLP